MAKDQGYLVPKKSVFNRIIGDSHLELEFARFLDDCDDVVSYAKNYFAVNFKLDYVNADGDISNYYPDFLVKLSDKRIFIVETKGLEDLDVPLKMERLRQWCEDINRVQGDVRYDFVYVDEEGFEKYKPKSFASRSKSSASTRMGLCEESISLAYTEIGRALKTAQELDAPVVIRRFCCHAKRPHRAELGGKRGRGGRGVKRISRVFSMDCQ